MAAEQASMFGGLGDAQAQNVMPIDIYVCDKCEIKFTDFTQLSNHNMDVHGSMTANLPRVPQTTIRSLAGYTDEQILAKLAERGAAFVCVCGIIFKDQTLFYLHRGCHNPTDPKKCQMCGFAAQDWKQFHGHFLAHKSPQGIAS